MQNSLFYSQKENFLPLAEKMRPKELGEILGSIKDNPAFQAWFAQGVKQSCILWGAPGTGKTTIALVAAQKSKKEFIKIHAFNSGVREIREIIEKATKLPNSILLFVDEVHNFNKSQQDILLDAVEKSLLTFIAATTENPAVSINRALLSRCINFELKPHKHNDLASMVDRCLQQENKTIEASAKELLIRFACGDARALLTKLEILIDTSKDLISTEQTKKMLDKNLIASDANSYYDCVSALQKSMRGSDVDASLYWLARLLSQGAELKAIARRILVTAAEDVGMADPQALVIANAAYNAALNLGMPEARIPLAQAVVYLAKAPKSNKSYQALDKALADCYNNPAFAVPKHLRNLKEADYKYPHNYPDAFIEQQYLPDELINKKYYTA